MEDSERYKLLYGPYVPPKCRIGDKLACEFRGREVKVRLMTDAPIQWPAHRGGLLPAVIVCGDLIRAVRVESEIAVAHHWGVSPATVKHWRRALGVPRTTRGTLRLAIDYTDEKLTPEVRAMAGAAMAKPTTRAKLSAARKGKPPHPNMTAAQREWARRPKSAEFKRKVSEFMRELWQNPEEHGLPARHDWTDDEIALLGTQSDAAIARQLGLTEAVVYNQRRRLRIARPVERWSDDQIRLLGTATDAEIARRLGKNEAAVRGKRLKQKIPSTIRRWTPEEIALLGRDSDPNIARKLGRPAWSVWEKRKSLGIAPFGPREWTDEDDSWLGTDTDLAVAKGLGRTAEAVRLRRNKLGIKPWRE
jgi:hypothetical protein